MNYFKSSLLSLTLAGLIISPGTLLAQATSVNSAAPLTNSATSPFMSNVKLVAPPAETETAKTSTETSATKKCGVNTFSVADECGIGAFKSLYFQCYDGYKEKINDTTTNSCKSSVTWQEYAKKTCDNRCGITAPTATQPSTTTSGQTTSEQSVPGQKPQITPTPITLIVPASPVAVCAINEALLKQYDSLMENLQKATSANNKAEVDAISQKITNLKQEMIVSEKSCQTVSTQTQTTTQTAPTAAVPTIIKIDRCAEAKQWEEKIGYYKKISELGEAELKNNYGFSKDDVNRILLDLEKGFEEVKSQCVSQNSLSSTSSQKSIIPPAAIANPVKPVAVQSVEEIKNYYNEKIQNIATNETSTDEQLKQFKELNQEKNSLTEEFIKSRKEIEATELGSLTDNIQISKGQIKVNETIVETTGKKILFNVENTSVSVEPTASNVIIKEKLEVNTNAISIENNVLKVGNSEVKLLASDVAAKLGVAPTTVELKEENAKAVYTMQVNEKRKLLGFIPVNVSRNITADADNGNILKQNRSWYAFMTTK